MLGGARSGKSTYAEKLVQDSPAPWCYLATAEAADHEMQTRIDQHRSRRGAGWITLEAPVDLALAVRSVPLTQAVLVDCLTLWLTNLMLGNHRLEKAYGDLEGALKAREAPTVLVSNEVGLGIVPDNALARSFRDEAGRLNQRMAAIADQVILLVAGLPMKVK